jgi:hypothetical protein
VVRIMSNLEGVHIVNNLEGVPSMIKFHAVNNREGVLIANSLKAPIMSNLGVPLVEEDLDDRNGNMKLFT